VTALRDVTMTGTPFVTDTYKLFPGSALRLPVSEWLDHETKRIVPAFQSPGAIAN
jgi:hypothetical protein